MKRRYLVLENGQIFEGFAFGADVPAVGELVFNTSVCGYMELLTDPNCFGQIVLQTFPLIGNYGAIPQDAEGICRVKGYAVRECCETPSNFRNGGSLDAYLRENGVPGIYGIDTREITRVIRESGGLNAMLCDFPPSDMESIVSHTACNAVDAVSCRAPFVLQPPGEVKHKTALMDYGVKKSLLRELIDKGCAVTVFPCDTKADDILRGDFDGVLLSDGPGDPRENAGRVCEIGKLFGKLPLLGIGLGHQLLALSQGAETEKLAQGHRGASQPVRDLMSESTYITSQNHGYTVVADSVKNGTVRFRNANDGTCEGIEYDNGTAFSVQFQPESHSGPKDTSFLFNKFCDLMGGNR